MNTEERMSQANTQLDRTLGFFSRVDTKHSVILAIDTGMLAFLASILPAPSSLTNWLAIAPGITVFLLAVSIGFLLAGGKPNLHGGEESLIYFKEIAKRTEAGYIDAWSKASDEDHLRDALGQVWRNSQILAEKFSHLNKALMFLVVAMLPWLTSIVTLSVWVPRAP